MKELAEFYQKGFELGLPQKHGDDHVGFQLSGVYLGFDLVDKVSGYPGAVSLWFVVDDLDETFERFVALGAQVKYPPTEKPWGDTLAAVLDPDGNVVGLVERRKSRKEN